MNEQNFERQLKEKTQGIEALLKKYLPEETGYARTVLEAMNYSMLAGGKQIRPLLMQEVFRMLGGSGKEIEPFSAAIEMIHTYSLIHDDLPAMDNDEYRRGRKTTHVVYGEAMGILAGDGLLNYAYETAQKAFFLKDGREVLPGAGIDPAEALKRMERIAHALEVLAKKAGIYGMIGGQTVDVEAEKKKSKLTGEQLIFIHENKTSALIEASMMCGAILAGADEKEEKEMERCARCIGLAFQIRDDILDVTGNSATLGKQVGSDERNHKQTYVTIYGMEKAVEDVERYSREAVTILEERKRDCDFLRHLIMMLINRQK